MGFRPQAPRKGAGYYRIDAARMVQQLIDVGEALWSPPMCPPENKIADANVISVMSMKRYRRSLPCPLRPCNFGEQPDRRSISVGKTPGHAAA